MSDPVLHNLFPTPLLEWETGEEALCTSLLEEVLARRDGGRALGAERVDIDCFGRDAPACAALTAVIHAGLERFLALLAGKPGLEIPSYSLTGEARLLAKDDYLEIRDSGPADISGVFYLETGDENAEDTGGVQELLDPRTGIKLLPGRHLSTSARFSPRNGLLLMYPGWVKRLIYPYQGVAPRVLLDFDLRFGAKDGDADWTGAGR